MNVSFRTVTFEDISEQLRQHLKSLPSAIDSFLEGHILESNHYELRASEQKAGYASVHRGSLITQFVLLPEFRRYGQSIFSQLKKLDEVQSAFVPTCDELFLSHALDEYRSLAKQAYFFAAPDSVPKVESSRKLRRAGKSNVELISQSSDDFFGTAEAIKRKIENHELFLTYSDEICVGFGVIEKSQLMDAVASIGMFVIPKYRRRGVGADTLRLLRLECQKQGLRPIAGCWYYNHLSKKTLERAGMFTQTRLLKIDF